MPANQGPEDTRPDPDALLARITEDAGGTRRGRLKIFLGMAAGVGKTCAMLRAAHRLGEKGIDVAVGIVETHGRAETQALIQGLEVLGRTSVLYKDVALEEMDLDGILARRPAVVLVDELAHTNVPGSRHPKRYQDVFELLDAGVDVYTTVNIQHLASRAPLVQAFAGVQVHEVVPDSVIDRADEIELIDLTPGELLERLKQGKVYPPGRAELASRNFFLPASLTALREMALRLTAERVDRQLTDLHTRNGQPTGSSLIRMIVGISGQESDKDLLRWARRVAYNLEAHLIAVYVKTRPSVDEAIVSENLRVARELGAEAVMTADVSVAEGLLRTARERNASVIAVGRSRRIWFKRTIARQILEADASIDVVIPGSTKSARAKKKRTWGGTSRPDQYVGSLFMVAVVTLLNLLLVPVLGYKGVSYVYLLLILLLGFLWGRGPVLFTAVLSAVVWDFLFIPPQYTFYISKADDVLLILLFLFTGLTTGLLNAGLKRQAQLVHIREQQTNALYRMSSVIAVSTNIDNLIRRASSQLEHHFGCTAVILRSDGKNPHLKGDPAHELSEKEMGVARWAFDHRQMAGALTDTLASAEFLHVPLVVAKRSVGVLCLKLPGKYLSVDAENLLNEFAQLIALGIERYQDEQSARHTAVLEESQRLYSALLDSVSHELRTPLTAIYGSASALLEPEIREDKNIRDGIARALMGSSRRLNRLVENLLDVSRIEGGFELKLEYHDPADVVSAAMTDVEDRSGEFRFQLNVMPDLKPFRMDGGLIVTALSNLILNAIQHAPAGSEITISVEETEGRLRLSIADHGPGIPPEQIESIFERFYRARNTVPGGLGLGLYIARTFARAHGGDVRAANRLGGGAIVTMELPMGAEQ